MHDQVVSINADVFYTGPGCVHDAVVIQVVHRSIVFVVIYKLFASVLKAQEKTHNH
jgi:hypothetical protein